MGRPRRYKYAYNEISHATFKYGFIEVTGERPKIGPRIDNWHFTFDGVVVKYHCVNHQSFRVTCPMCGKPIRSLHKYPEPGARWGCRKCLPHGKPVKLMSLYTLFRSYTLEMVMMMSVRKLEKLCGMNVVRAVNMICNQPEASIKSVWTYHPIDLLPFRTDDCKIPLIERVKRNRWRQKQRDKFYMLQRKCSVRAPMHPWQLKALKNYADDHGMSIQRCAAALIRWALLNTDIVQIRKV